ncbi:GntR family transcriptional regulator [Corynebacterium sp. J010B-136]|uniref:GntR family transcriptional regulator n=1 Tax=Corynebacterium sp. J010B-136 TaxID=2099401 RepID=UPI000CF89BC6|nr:GntR family transcriptional regulator [Corynebacterium sp. J010B-136]PQM73564.1 GntR family transcriptional regulator [Corynebacterium sp. J010B-136]
MDNSTQPLFRQIASLVEDSIVDGVLAEGARAPSTNELADFHSINPATARKGLNLLVDVGVLDKRRGIGMFVSEGAIEVIRQRRRSEFAADYVAPLIDEAVRLNYSRAALLDLIERVAESRGLYQ